MSTSDLRRPAVVFAIALPLVLALVVAGLALYARAGGFTPAPPAPETGPLAVAPVVAPDAGSQACTDLLAALPPDLPGDPALVGRPVTEPGVAAWAAAPRPVVLRCGLPRPQELTPTSTLTEVNGVSWLTITDGTPEPSLVTYVAVDRGVYVALTTPTQGGSAPVQTISNAITQTLPERPVQVR
ncbi:DUF3515 domain-containing protein [Pseudonocardia oroxyli]|uniref:DUF3515 domain-containing protein n=1 Tax=Pseudonocardia oroxyli TaxID=366584 RepID=A0A1G7WDQ4_PSEOR|nr:DUF3515 domain-containing protein [Pseudonocardia oroxyli]SDG70101.1 Protein of unknown function [Pseudonocardia oroxyli]